MPKVRARWKQKSCILRCPGCSRKIVVEFVGSYKVRAPSKAELAAAGAFDENALGGTSKLPPVGQRTKTPVEAGTVATPSKSDSPASVESTISRAYAQEEPPDDEGQTRGDGA